jgi:hypothetical protein
MQIRIWPMNLQTLPICIQQRKGSRAHICTDDAVAVNCILDDDLLVSVKVAADQQGFAISLPCV